MRAGQRIDAMSDRWSLHVPHPPARPGEQADFSYLRLAPAGAVSRPPPGATVEQTRELATSLVRILDDDARAQGPWDPHLSPAQMIAGLRYMLLTRAMDERLRRAQRQGQISFYMQCVGEEAVA